MSVFTEVLAQTNLPEPARNMIEDKLSIAMKLIQENNSRVLRINQSKAQDPSNTEYLDSVWKLNEEKDPEITELEEKYQAVVEEYERLLAALRNSAKKQIKPPLSEDEAQNLRKLVNESADTMNEARVAAAGMAEMADQMLKLAGKPVEGGIMSMLPEIESLKNRRGRKAAGGSNQGVYATRVADIQIDGRTTNRTVKKDGVDTIKGNWIYAADALSKQFNSEHVPGNTVAPEELERAYFDSKNVEFRDKASMPETHTFAFTKEIGKPNPNDGEIVKAPVTVNITVVQAKRSDAKTTEKPAEEKTQSIESATPEVKSEAKPEVKPAEGNAPTAEPNSPKQPGPATQKLIEAQKKTQNEKAQPKSNEAAPKK